MGEWWLFYKHIFIGELLDHLPIVGSLLLLLVILAGGFRTIGLPQLFWHRRTWDRAVAGMASGIFVTFAFYVAYLLDAADCVAERAPSSAFDGLKEWRGGWYFFGCLSCLAATAGVAFALPLAARLARLVPRSEREHVAKQPSPIGRVGRSLFIMTFLSGLTFAASIWWSAEQGALGALLARADFIDFVVWGEPEFMNGHRLAAILAGILSLSLLVGAFGGRRRLPASVSICVLLAWIIAADGFLAFTFHEAPVVSLAVIACFTLLAGRARYKIRIEALARHYDDPVSLEKGWTPSRPAEQRWQLPDWNATGPTLILVAVSGGGSRAAVWTAAILTALEEVQEHERSVMTPWNIGLITGASGGMVGATYYTLTLPRSPVALPRSPEQIPWHGITRDALLAAVAEESLSDVAHRLAFHDLPLAVIPKRQSRGDRGTRLEEALERHLRSRLPSGQTIPSTFAEMKSAEADGRFPSLVYTPMLVEDGRRLFISNADLGRQATSDGRILGGVERYSRNAFQFHQLFDGGLDRLSPWTAARLSASFPYVTPAPTLPTRPRRRVVDAGYWDNYGVNLCSSWLEDCLSDRDRRAWLEQFRNVLLLQIRDGVVCYGAKEAPDEEHTRTLARGMEWLTSPAEAVLAARSAVAVYRGDEQVESLSEIFGASFSTAVVEFQRTASLSWALTDEEVRAIKENAGSEVARIAPMMANFVTPAATPIARPAWFLRGS